MYTQMHLFSGSYTLFSTEFGKLKLYHVCLCVSYKAGLLVSEGLAHAVTGA